MSRSAFLAVLGAICIALGVGLGSIAPASRQPEIDDATGTPTSAHKLIQVHVAGWVRAPGVVVLPEGSIVADAVEAAGGLLPEAVGGTLNLAARIADGDQVFVSGPGSSADGIPEDGRVALNRATAADLEGLPGVGPVLAQRIVTYREENGHFREVEDLLGVPGIGESKLASLRDLVRIP